jgi:hypothetical protein
MAQDIICTTACTVTVQLEPAPATEQSFADTAELGGYMMLACIVIYGAKKLLQLFEGGPHEG